MPSKVVIIAALEREVRPLISGPGWRRSKTVRALYGAFENDQALVVCGGIGPAAARRAAETAVAGGRPAFMLSVGLAGALVPEWKVGQVMVPATIIQASRGGPVEGCGMAEVPGIRPEGILISASEIAGPEAKRFLAGHYRAQAIDMEAAPVAEVACSHGIPFLALKAISDEYDFVLPDLAPFVDNEGRFLERKFTLHLAVRPRLWSVVKALASNTSRASLELCMMLRELLSSGVLAPALENGAHHSLERKS